MQRERKGDRRNQAIPIVVVGGILIVVILVFGTLWTGRTAQRDTIDAVRSVSSLYLDELAGRREQVVENNLKDNMNVINIAIDLLPVVDNFRALYYYFFTFCCLIGYSV